MADPRPTPARYPPNDPERAGESGFRDDLIELKRMVEKPTAEWPAPRMLMICGDVDEVDFCDAEIRAVMGGRFCWLPVMGNHDFESRDGFKPILERAMKGRSGPKGMQVSLGPKGTRYWQYVVTYRNGLLVMTNGYWDGTDRKGAEIGLTIERAKTVRRPDGTTTRQVKRAYDAWIVPANLAWHRRVLGQAKARHKFVFCHEPCWPFHRHQKDSLSDHPGSRDRFWKMLAETNVRAFFCGHTHWYSTYRWPGNNRRDRWEGHTSSIIPDPVGVWQIDAGAVRGRLVGNRHDRVIVQVRVDADDVRVRTRISRRLGPLGSNRWEVPPNGTRIRGRPAMFDWSLVKTESAAPTR